MLDHLVGGHVVGGRYRLERELSSDASSQTWRATDRRLARRVAVRVFVPALDHTHLQRQAGVAASLTHPRVVRVFDSGFDAAHFFLVTELLPASLAWARLPLSTPEAISVGIEVAEALCYAHERGVAHGEVGTGSVMLSEAGAKVSGFAFTQPVLDGATPDVAGDLRALGVLLHEVLGGAGSDPPRDLARVVAGLTAGDYRSADGVMRDLRSLRDPDQARRLRRRPLVVATSAVAASVLVAAGVLGATRLGDRAARDHDPQLPDPVGGTPHVIASVSDFDPLGDGEENRRSVERVYDGDPRTFWSTERYRGGSDFSGLKSGVGVVLDLGSPSPVGAVQVLLAHPGCSFELRHAPNRAGAIEGWEVAASVRRAEQTTVMRFDAVEARWWLLWVTELVQGVPGAERSWSCGVSQVALYPP